MSNRLNSSIKPNLRGSFEALEVRNRAYRTIFLDQEGRLSAAGETVLKDLVDAAELFKNISGDAFTLAIAEGQRRLLRHILECVGTDKETLLKWILKLGASYE